MPESGATILVVDDDAGIRDLLASTLRFAGYRVLLAADAASALAALTRPEVPDAIVLDVMLPDTDGLDVLRLLRSQGDETPVVFLTARDAPADRVAGLTSGADDYVTKPFTIAEVTARLQAVLRRAGRTPAPAPGPVEPAPPAAPAVPVPPVPPVQPEPLVARVQPVPPVRPVPAPDDVLICGDLVLDSAAKRVTRAGTPVELSPTEFRLLEYLLENSGRVVSKAQILDRVWHYDFGGDVGVVEKFVSTLRRKVDPAGATPLIQTVRGFGYCVRLPSS